MANRECRGCGGRHWHRELRVQVQHARRGAWRFRQRPLHLSDAHRHAAVGRAAATRFRGRRVTRRMASADLPRVGVGAAARRTHAPARGVFVSRSACRGQRGRISPGARFLEAMVDGATCRRDDRGHGTQAVQLPQGADAGARSMGAARVVGVPIAPSPRGGGSRHGRCGAVPARPGAVPGRWNRDGAGDPGPWQMARVRADGRNLRHSDRPVAAAIARVGSGIRGHPVVHQELTRKRGRREVSHGAAVAESGPGGSVHGRQSFARDVLRILGRSGGRGVCLDWTHGCVHDLGDRTNGSGTGRGTPRDGCARQHVVPARQSGRAVWRRDSATRPPVRLHRRWCVGLEVGDRETVDDDAVVCPGRSDAGRRILVLGHRARARYQRIVGLVGEDDAPVRDRESGSQKPTARYLARDGCVSER